MGLESVLLYLKRWGSYQILTYVLIAICMNFPTAWQLYGITFEGPSFPMFHDCAVEKDVGLKIDPCTYHPIKKNLIIRSGTEADYDSTRTEDCKKFIYLPKVSKYEFPEEDGTIQQQFDLVCDKKNWITWSQVVFNSGTLFGAALCPPFADYIGRKSIFFSCQLLMCIFGLAMSLSPNFTSFCVFQFLTGAFAMGNDLCGFVIACELFPKDMRSVVSPFIYTFFALGSAILAGWSKLFLKWNDLQLFISLLSLVTLIYWPFCPESWRWLLSKGRKQEAEQYLNTAAKMNGLPPIDSSILNDEENEVERGLDADQTFLRFLMKPKLLMYTLAMAFIMSSANLVYFGLGLMVATLSGEFYENFVALALVEIIGVFLAVAIVSVCGRRYPISAFFFWGAAFLFLAVLFERTDTIRANVEQDLRGKLITSFVVISKIGVTAAYCVILVYIQEIFPTFMRASGIGLTAGLGNIGTLLAPVAILSSELDFEKFYIPIIVFGCVSFIAGLVTLVIPETIGRTLPNTIEDVLNMPHSLSPEEWKEARRQARIIFGFEKKFSSGHVINNNTQPREQNIKSENAEFQNGNGRDNPAYNPDSKGVSRVNIGI